jgi:hypothetical protein
MARDPEKAVLRVVDESPPEPQEVVRLTSCEGGVTRAATVPLAAPLARLEPEERTTEERRTHEPDYESIAESTDLAALPLEDTWNDESIRSRPVPWGWFALIGLGCATAVAWSISSMVSNRHGSETARTKAITAFDKEEQEIAEAEATVDRIVACTRAYCEAGSIEKLLPVVRHPERVRPLMEHWYGEHPLKSSKFESLNLFQPITMESRGSFWMVSCTMKDGSKRRMLLEETEGGQVQVDWETEVCYQPMDWDEYCREKPVGSLDFRVKILEDNYYSHEFSDSNRWACYQLSALNGDQLLYGYLDRQSVAGQQLRVLQQANSDRQISVILRISRPTDLKSPRGVVIERLMSPRWSYVNPPDA